jgi:hypothetical protein
VFILIFLTLFINQLKSIFDYMIFEILRLILLNLRQNEYDLAILAFYVINSDSFVSLQVIVEFDMPDISDVHSNQYGGFLIRA